MDAHSRDRNMLHKCNRARREHVASNMLSWHMALDVKIVIGVIQEKIQKVQMLYKLPQDRCMTPGLR